MFFSIDQKKQNQNYEQPSMDQERHPMNQRRHRNPRSRRHNPSFPENNRNMPKSPISDRKSLVDPNSSSNKKRNHNYIPKKGHLNKPTMRRTREEMSDLDYAKEQLEGQLLEFQLQRDSVI